MNCLTRSGRARALPDTETASVRLVAMPKDNRETEHPTRQDEVAEVLDRSATM